MSQRWNRLTELPLCNLYLFVAILFLHRAKLLVSVWNVYWISLSLKLAEHIVIDNCYIRRLQSSFVGHTCISKTTFGDRKTNSLHKMASLSKVSPLNVEESSTGQQTRREKTNASFPVHLVLQNSARRKVGRFLISMFSDIMDTVRDGIVT